MGERRSGYRDLVGKLHRTRTLGISRRRRESNVTTDLQEIG
jgi:hypothetical protein